MIQHYCCLLGISSIDRIDWRPPQKNKLSSRAFRDGEFCRLKTETRTNEIWKWFPLLFMSLTCAIYPRLFRFLFFPSFSLSYKRRIKKKNFNFLLSTWCFYWMRAWNAFEDVFIHSTLSLELQKSKDDIDWVQKATQFQEVAQKSKKNWNGTSMIKTLSKFNFLSHLFSTQCLTFMTWRFLLRKYSSPWRFLRNWSGGYINSLSFDLDWNLSVYLTTLQENKFETISQTSWNLIWFFFHLKRGDCYIFFFDLFICWKHPKICHKLLVF